MPDYERIQTEKVSAHQWHKNGDHPSDNCEEIVDTASGIPFLSEGEVVRRFRHPSFTGKAIHPVCGRTWDDHGWIEPTQSHGQKHWGEGLTVCPGSYVITAGVSSGGRITYSVAGQRIFEKMYRKIEPRPHVVEKTLAYADIYRESVWNRIPLDEQRELLEATNGRGILVVPDTMDVSI